MPLNKILPQGPRQHCGAASPHEQHGSVADNVWCDGIPPLPAFVELCIRVPLTGDLDFENADHAEVLRAITEEGIGTFTWDQLIEPTTIASLRLRWGGKDAVYPLINGKLL